MFSSLKLLSLGYLCPLGTNLNLNVYVKQHVESNKMNLEQARSLLESHGIHQLNKGESLADAIDHVANGTKRKGYKIKHDSGAMMTENQIIANENKEAFHRSFTPAEFNEDEVEIIDDIPDSDDFREDKTSRGNILNCFYCGDCLRVDGSDNPEDDYDSPQDTIHCDGCMNDAISRLAM